MTDWKALCGELESAIEALVARKPGNRELMIYRNSDGSWTADLGNPTDCVMLGEVTGEIVGQGPTLADALEDLSAELKRFTDGDGG